MYLIDFSGSDADVLYHITAGGLTHLIPLNVMLPVCLSSHSYVGWLVSNSICRFIFFRIQKSIWNKVNIKSEIEKNRSPSVRLLLDF